MFILAAVKFQKQLHLNHMQAIQVKTSQEAAMFFKVRSEQATQLKDVSFSSCRQKTLGLFASIQSKQFDIF